jgi:hypothetical protein
MGLLARKCTIDKKDVLDLAVFQFRYDVAYWTIAVFLAQIETFGAKVTAEGAAARGLDCEGIEVTVPFKIHQIISRKGQTT